MYDLKLFCLLLVGVYGCDMMIGSYVLSRACQLINYTFATEENFNNCSACMWIIDWREPKQSMKEMFYLPSFIWHHMN